MLYLFDTNAITDQMRDSPLFEARIAALNPRDQLGTCVVVIGEVWFGINRMPAGRKRDGYRVKATRVLAPLNVEPISTAAAEAYIRSKVVCVASGRAVGDNDLWIAAVPGLLLEDWSK